MKYLYSIYKYLSIAAIIGIVGYFVYNLVLSAVDMSMSVTAINVISTLLFVFIGLPIIISGVMANDSGKGGFTIKTVQFLTLSYLFIYFIGLVGSIGLLYSDIDNKNILAKYFASASLIELTVIALFFALMFLKEKYSDR